jgi:hypothetical protein
VCAALATLWQYVLIECSYSTSGTGIPIKLATMLPLVNESGQRELGLLATKHYVVGKKISKYWGEILDIGEARQRPSYYMWEHVSRRIVIDAANVLCKAKYANNTVCNFAIWTN